MIWRDEKSEIAVVRIVFYDTATVARRYYTVGRATRFGAGSKKQVVFIASLSRELPPVVVPRVRPSYPFPARPPGRPPVR